MLSGALQVQGLWDRALDSGLALTEAFPRKGYLGWELKGKEEVAEHSCSASVVGLWSRLYFIRVVKREIWTSKEMDK